MEKVIKFRGRTISTGKFVYGYLIKGNCSYIITKENFDVSVVSMSGHLSAGAEIVDDKTVGQFTGLYDNNRKEVYEGDILSVIIDSKKHIGKVYYENSSYCISGYGYFSRILNKGCCFYVRGNIHENLDLLPTKGE